jgi:DNA-3-methyladenine glycosylase I
MTAKQRCAWATSDPLYLAYHDREWGRPVHDDDRLFEMLILEGAQAGLSWITVLKKRENYRKAFDRFDARKIAHYDRQKVIALMQDAGIVRNRAKIEAAIGNAKAFLAVQRELGSFDSYLWSFTGGRTLRTPRRGANSVVASTAESDAMSKDLKRRGFKFVGSTICYALMQACGLVDDHQKGCFLSRRSPALRRQASVNCPTSTVHRAWRSAGCPPAPRARR